MVHIPPCSCWSISDIVETGIAILHVPYLRETLRTNMVLVGSSKTNGLLGLKLFDHIMAPLVSLIEIFSTSLSRNLSKMYKKTRARQMIF